MKIWCSQLRTWLDSSVSNPGPASSRASELLQLIGSPPQNQNATPALLSESRRSSFCSRKLVEIFQREKMEQCLDSVTQRLLKEKVLPLFLPKPGGHLTLFPLVLTALMQQVQLWVSILELIKLQGDPNNQNV